MPIMPVKLKLLVGIGLAIILVAGIYWDTHTGGRCKSSLLYAVSGEPSYEGNTITYWLANWYQEYGKPNVEAEEAVIAMGAKAAPWLGAQVQKGCDAYYESEAAKRCARALKAFEILGPKGTPAVPYLINSLGHNSDYAERALLCIGASAVPPLTRRFQSTLSDTNSPWYFTGMRMSIRRSSNYFIRGQILSIFDRMGTNAATALPALIVAASMDLPAYNTIAYQQNIYATMALIGYNTPDVVAPVLLKRFAERKAERGKIAKAMELLGDRNAKRFMPSLISSLSDVETDEPNKIAVGAAITNVASGFAKELVPVFISAINDQSNSEAVVCCMAGYLATVGVSQPQMVVPVLKAAYTNASLGGRSSIAKALARFPEHSRSIVPLMLSDCQRTDVGTSDNRWRIDLTISAKTIAPDHSGILNALLSDLKDRIAYIRQQTIYALGGLGTNGTEAVPHLIACLSHADMQTRLDATRALNEIGASSDSYIAALVDNVSCSNVFLTQESCNSLANLASTRKLAFVELVRIVAGNTGSRDDRRQVRYALDNISTKDPSFMLECLDDPDANIRSGALRIFDDLTCRVPQGIPKLRELANGDNDSVVRTKAAEVLRRQLQ